MAAIRVELPDAIIRELVEDPREIERHVLEAVAVEGYRSRKLSRGEVGRLLGLSWHETEAFLAERGVSYHYTLSDLEEDRESLQQLRACSLETPYAAFGAGEALMEAMERDADRE